MKTLFLLLGLALGAWPILAHHSFSAEYDDTKPVKISGVVTKVEWMNPHIWLMRRGISKDVIQPGMMINVEGFRAKDGSDNANGTKVTFPDGRMVFTASQEPDSKRDGKN
jgi:hypothetical protein